jgi:hypothetical protein
VAGATPQCCSSSSSRVLSSGFFSAWCSALRRTRMSFWLSVEHIVGVVGAGARLPGAVKAGGVVEFADQLFERDVRGL